jgi:hypothetical protein
MPHVLEVFLAGLCVHVLGRPPHALFVIWTQQCLISSLLVDIFCHRCPPVEDQISTQPIHGKGVFESTGREEFIA